MITLSYDGGDSIRIIRNGSSVSARITGSITGLDRTIALYVTHRTTSRAMKELQPEKEEKNDQETL